ncbi:hypothetical protein [Janthinobacterium fluminis]|uniref:Uncharacterized protein n=1 Tax=Janthinobacterium fluminis TaxID=2987524 RepID=A0ABT5JZB3_9BURK|nr:hypothetical protein [Janthinobacterium fluminis]MDC8758071.1 hypothetical protein [Janthinobacterium fluminis]
MSPAPLLKSAPAAPAAPLQLQYQLLSNGAVVGSIEASRSRFDEDGEALLALHYRVRIRSGGIWSDYSLDADEEIVIGAGGVRRYANAAHEDGDKSSVLGGLEHGVMTLRVDDGKVRLSTFRQAEYDATSEDAPGLFLASGREAAVLRVLDLEHVDIDEVAYRRLPDETLALPGRPRLARVLSFASTRRKLAGQQWYVEDASGDVLVREHSEEPGERNEVLLINWTMGK